MEAFLEFEKPIATLEKKLSDLRELTQGEGVDLSKEIRALEQKLSHLTDEIFAKLSPWQRVQLSRHPNRPYTREYLETLFPDFMEVYGDRAFQDDHAIMGGFATWPPQDPKSDLSKKFTSTPVLIMGHQKGRTTKQKVHRNFGMARPEGYRKVLQLIALAERFRIPILTLVDTPGAYPGIETEERGQAQAIAECIRAFFELTVPVMSVVIGEGGSGGALAIGVANKVLMQEYSNYSVISPEGCASILWSDATLAEKASERLKASPEDLKKFGVIDAIIPEPKGGAHRDWEENFSLFAKTIAKEFEPLLKKKWATEGSAKIAPEGEKLRLERIKKFRGMGSVGLSHTQGQATK